MVMPRTRTVLIVNPRSQGGRLGKRWTEIADTIGRAFPFDEAITEGPGDATRLTREALRAGAERVVAIGDDGTINEVVNGVLRGRRRGDRARGELRGDPARDRR